MGIVDKTGDPVPFIIKKIYTTNRGFTVLGSDGASYLLEIKSFDPDPSVITATKLNNNNNLQILEGQQILSRLVS